MLLDLVSMMCLTSAVSAAYPVTAANLSRSFRLHDGNQRGGCNRISQYNSPMQPKVLLDLNDAFDLADATFDRITKVTTPSEAYLRLLLQLFFGISFDKDNFQINATDGSSLTYRVVRGEWRFLSAAPTCD